MNPTWNRPGAWIACLLLLPLSVAGAQTPPEVAPEILEVPLSLSLETVNGTVTHVDRHLLSPGVEGLDLTLDVGGRTLVAHLGPETFVNERMRFVPGDTVEVKGSPLPGEPSLALLTLSIRKDGKKLELRTEHGRPKYPLPTGR